MHTRESLKSRTGIIVAVQIMSAMNCELAIRWIAFASIALDLVFIVVTSFCCGIFYPPLRKPYY